MNSDASGWWAALTSATPHCALDRPARHNNERLYEEDALQRRRPRRPRGARHLEVASTGKDDSALHDVVRHKGMQRSSCSGCAEDQVVSATIEKLLVQERVRRITPPEGAPAIDEAARLRHRGAYVM